MGRDEVLGWYFGTYLVLLQGRWLLGPTEDTLEGSWEGEWRGGDICRRCRVNVLTHWGRQPGRMGSGRVMTFVVEGLMVGRVLDREGRSRRGLKTAAPLRCAAFSLELLAAKGTLACLGQRRRWKVLPQLPVRGSDSRSELLFHSYHGFNLN